MLHRILVLLDGGGLADRALPYAAELAAAVGGSLVLVRTVHTGRREPPRTRGDQRALRTAQAYLRRRAGQLAACGLAAERVVVPGYGPDVVIAVRRSRRGRLRPSLSVVATYLLVVLLHGL